MEQQQEREQAAGTDRDGWEPVSEPEPESESGLVGGRAAGVEGGEGEEISGLIRRVRRLAKVSQRELAQVLGVSQSAVAKWETGRACPSVRMLVRILGVAELGLAAVRADGERVAPMRAVAARDAGGRRYPAHTFVWAQGWWAPEGAGTTAWYTAVLGRSAELGLPRVRYSRWWQLGRAPTLADVVDHPSWGELVAEAREGWRPPVRDLVPIPEWAFVDTRKSRNRWPDEFRALARAVGLNRSRESGAHMVPVETPRKPGHLRQ